MNQEKTGKKILYVITKSNFGGAQRYVHDLAIAMTLKGHQVAVACGGQGELVTKLQAANIEIFEVGGLGRDISFINEWRAVYSLANIIRDFDPDVVHLNSSKAGFLGAFIARALFVPKVIFTAHGWPFREPRKITWKAMAWAGSYFTSILAHRVILVSHDDYTHTSMFGIKRKCEVIHTSIDSVKLLSREESRSTLFSEEVINNHRHNVWLVTNAEINHNKNHALAIDAVAEFNSSHTTKIFYTIIGTGDLLGELKEQVDLRGLNDYVHFLGYVKEASQYLSGFDMFILTSKKEGLPYAILEAGTAGVPCIASRVGGIPEVIINKETGLLVDPNNHMSVVEALDFLLTNSNRRTEYSNNLSSLLENDFSTTLMVQKTEELYN